MIKSNRLWISTLGIVTISLGAVLPVWADGSSSQDILRQGLLGAATGALSAEMSGGKAGKGALIGAGTNVIGGALLGFLTDSSGGTRTVSYAQSYYPPVQTYSAVPQQRIVYAQPESYYSRPPASGTNQMILRQGLLGAGVGAISSEASGGKAGTGALVGAGTNVIGGALLDTLFAAPPATTPVYYVNSASTAAASLTPRKHIVRKFAENGQLISEEEFWE